MCVRACVRVRVWTVKGEGVICVCVRACVRVRVWTVKGEEVIN